MLRSLSQALPRASVLATHRSCRLFNPVAFSRLFSAQPQQYDVPEGYMAKTRNIGISAHIDSGKTTLTERILFYTGRIREIHDVRGKDGVGAKMDHMELEREKGITIQSAATYSRWGDHHINIIDTPGHVDFTIEVERALRVLDGAVMVLCGVAGVQSQSITVDRQMRRYGVPRVVFVNKLDRTGANPWKAIRDLRKTLKLNAVAVQIPIGLEANLQGVVDLVEMKSRLFQGDYGEKVVAGDIPPELLDQANEKRQELIENLANVDEEIAELFLMEEDPTVEQLKAAIRRATIAQKFVPVFMGSAFKNKGVQPLLDGIAAYLPSPAEMPYQALDIANNEQQFDIVCSPTAPLIALAFKLEESRFGQLTYLRIYQGTLKKGQQIYNVNARKKVKVPRIVRMHANEMEDVDEAGAGDVVAIFGVDCASMDSFTDGSIEAAMTSMFVPQPVMSLTVRPKDTQHAAKFGKAISKFTKEDPTLRVTVDQKTKDTILSGMGELHLEIYVERIKREYGVDCIVGQPSVNYTETVTRKAEFNYLHKKQSGGAGQYAKVIGYIEPLEPERIARGDKIEFVNRVIGTNIPPEFIPSCEKGAMDAAEKGPLIGHPLQGVRVVVTDGQAHAVDSSDMAFRIAMQAAVRQAFQSANPAILEPIMNVEVTVPQEFQGTVMAGLNKRMGLIQGSDMSEDGSTCTIRADVPLSQMFGYSTDLRSSTQGKGEFTMEYKEHQPVNREAQEKLIKQFREANQEASS